MRIHPALLACAALALVAASFSPPQIIDREIPLDGVSSLRLNVSGSVHLVPVPGRTSIAFHVVDSGPSTPPVSVSLTRTHAMLTVSITGPSQGLVPFVGASGYELQLQYPSSLRLDVREFAGRVHADRISAPMQIYDADGNIVIDAAPAALTAQADSGSISVADAHARLTLSTIDGNIDAQLAPSWAGSLIRLETQNGNLRLKVPAGFRARYDVNSAEGSVSNPFRSAEKGPLVFILAEQGNIAVSAM